MEYWLNPVLINTVMNRIEEHVEFVFLFSWRAMGLDIAEQQIKLL